MQNHLPTNRKARRPGVTLLELLLAISLATLVVLGAAGMIKVQVRAATKARSSAQLDQISRAVLNRVADDVRGTIRYVAAAANSSKSSSSGSSSGSSSSSSSSSSSTSSSSSSQSGSSSSSTSASTPDDGTTSSATDSTATTVPPGLFGQIDSLIVDVSRLPRPDEMAAGTVTGDTHSVAFFIAMPPGANAPGLARQQFVRPSDQTPAFDPSSIGSVADLFAPEVCQIEFQYFDGTAWATEWDSSSSGSLPVAVGVAFAVRPAQAGPEYPAQISGSLFTSDHNWPPESVERITIRVPSAPSVSETNYLASATTSNQDLIQIKSKSKSSSGGSGGGGTSKGTGS